MPKESFTNKSGSKQIPTYGSVSRVNYKKWKCSGTNGAIAWLNVEHIDEVETRIIITRNGYNAADKLVSTVSTEGQPTQFIIYDMN